MPKLRYGLLRLGAPACLLACGLFGSELCVTVMDAVPLPLPHASVNATNLATGKPYVAQADRGGRICLSNIPEGLYSVEAYDTGFMHVRYYPVQITAAAKTDLSFALPLGYVSEGAIGDEATLSGTLLKAGSPVTGADVCVSTAARTPRFCTVTNDIGEYALVVPVGEYDAQVSTRDGTGMTYRLKVDVSTAGVHRDLLSLDGNGGKP